MAKKKVQRSGNSNALSNISDSVKQIQEGLQVLRYSPKATDEALTLLVQSLHLQSDAFVLELSQRQEIIQSSRKAMGETLRQAAEKEGCECEFRPPYAYFGCVRFFEQQPNTWRVSVLDDVAIQTIETVNAEILATVALEIIVGIEAVLTKAKAFAKVFESNYQLLHKATHFQFVSPNILMLLMTSDKSLKAHLTSSDDLTRTVVSRAQMAYLLKAFKQGSDLEISFTGATQHSTKEPHLFLSLPSFLEPRKHPQPIPISAVSLVVKK